MIKAISADFIGKKYINNVQNRKITSFKSLKHSSDRDIFVRQSAINKEDIEMTRKKSQYLFLDSQIQYKYAQESLKNIEQEILNNISDVTPNRYRTIQTLNNKKYIINADYSYDGEKVKISKLHRQNPNGSVNLIEADENGNVVKITNGIIQIGNSEFLIGEQFCYNNGELEDVKLSTIAGKNQSATRMEFIYSDGKMQQFYRTVNEKI